MSGVLELEQILEYDGPILRQDLCCCLIVLLCDLMLKLQPPELLHLRAWPAFTVFRTRLLAPAATMAGTASDSTAAAAFDRTDLSRATRSGVGKCRGLEVKVSISVGRGRSHPCSDLLGVAHLDAAATLPLAARLGGASCP